MKNYSRPESRKKLEEDFKTYAPPLNIPKRILHKKIFVDGHYYLILGWDNQKRKYPIITQRLSTLNNEIVYYKMPVELVLKNLSNIPKGSEQYREPIIKPINTKKELELEIKKIYNMAWTNKLSKYLLGSSSVIVSNSKTDETLAFVSHNKEVILYSGNIVKAKSILK